MNPDYPRIEDHDSQQGALQHPLFIPNHQGMHSPNPGNIYMQAPPPNPGNPYAYPPQPGMQLPPQSGNPGQMPPYPGNPHPSPYGQAPPHPNIHGVNYANTNNNNYAPGYGVPMNTPPMSGHMTPVQPQYAGNIIYVNTAANTNTVNATQSNQSIYSATNLPSHSVSVKCPKCNYIGMTVLREENDTGTFICIIIMVILGLGFLPLLLFLICLIPSYQQSKKVIHSCASCRVWIGQYSLKR